MQVTPCTVNFGSGVKEETSFMKMPYYKGLAISAVVGAGLPLFGVLDGDGVRETIKNIKLKDCAKYAGVGALLYSAYKATDTFVKSDDKKKEKRIKLGISSAIGAISFPMILRTLSNECEQKTTPFFKSTNGKIVLVMSSFIGAFLPYLENGLKSKK